MGHPPPPYRANVNVEEGEIGIFVKCYTAKTTT